MSDLELRITELAIEAETLGLNSSMYYLLPLNKREAALRLDIEKRRKEEKDGQN